MLFKGAISGPRIGFPLKGYYYVFLRNFPRLQRSRSDNPGEACGHEFWALGFREHHPPKIPKRLEPTTLTTHGGLDLKQLSKAKEWGSRFLGFCVADGGWTWLAK